VAELNLASVGGYLLTPDFFEYLAKADVPEDGEFMIQPIMQAMMDDGRTIYAREIDGTYYDTGDKLEYLKTVIDFGLAHDELGDPLRAYLQSKFSK